MKKMLFTLLFLVLMAGTAQVSYGVPGHLTNFNATYGTSGTALDTCTTCHNPDYSRNPYGLAFASSGHDFKAIEGADSDGDGYKNIDEITARTFPGDSSSHPAPAADTTPPTVTGFSIPSTSASLTVSISSFTATDNVGVTGYLVNESATAPSASAAGWSATKPASYTFTTAGAKTLYAWAKDAAGNVSASKSASTTITIATADTTPPAVTGFSIPSTSTSLTVSISSFTATDNVGVTGYLVKESSSAPTASTGGWTATPPSSYTFTTAGAKTLYAWAKDAAGNVSASKSASVNISVPTSDTSAPTVPTNVKAVAKDSRSVSLSWTASTDNVGVSEYLIYRNGSQAGTSKTTQFSDTGLAPKTTYSYSVKARDAAGNTSTASSSITVTTTADSASDVQVYSYGPVESPVVSTNPAEAKPIGVGTVAVGGNTLNLTVRTGGFSSPVDVYVILYAPSEDPSSLYVLRSDKTFVPVKDGKPEPWKRKTTDPINESLYGVVSGEEMQAGTYTIGLLVAPAGSLKQYTYWITSFVIESGGKDGEVSEHSGSVYSYEPVAVPVVSTNPAEAKPIGVGDIATGGDTLSLRVKTGTFSERMDLYVSLYTPADDPFTIYFLKPSKNFAPLGEHETEGGGSERDKPSPWKKRVTGPIDETLFGTAKVSGMKKGPYTVGLMATPSGKDEGYTYWTTTFMIE